MSHGTTMRHITKKSLDECRVALPPVTDQLRIADLLATIDATIADEKEGLARAQGLVIAFRENRIGAESRIIKLGDVLQQIGVGESPRCLDRLPNVGEWGVLKVSAVRQAHFDRTQVKALPPSTPPKLAAQFESGDLLMTRSNTLERVGMACIARGDVSQLLLSDLIFRMRLDEERLLPEYAAHALSTRAVRDQIERAAVGTSGSMKKVNQGIIRSLEVAAPVIAEQRQFLKAISALESVVDAYGRAIEQHLELKRAVLASLTSGLHRIPKSYDRFLTDEDPDAITPEPATA
jgi:type I restriction enzyme S subunit